MEHMEAKTDTEPATDDNVIPLNFSRRPRRLEATSEEVAEWRRMRPLLKRMMQEWQEVKTHCPLARKILYGD